jgi:hypothetical protein
MRLAAAKCFNVAGRKAEEKLFSNYRKMTGYLREKLYGWLVIPLFGN